MKKIIWGVIIIFVLIALFFFKNKGNNEVEDNEVQEITVKVDGTSFPGYFPSATEIKKGKRVRLNFVTKNEQSCALAINVPDANVYNKILPETGLTPIEFTPEKEGEFVIFCGMNGMFLTKIKIIV